MACSSLIELLRSCGGAEAIVGGLTNEVYMIAFADTKPLATSLTNEIYALSSNNIVNEIGVKTGKSFVKVSLLKDVSKNDTTLTKNAPNGTLFHTNAFNLTLGGLTTENDAFYESIINQPVVVIYKTKTGKYFCIGLKGGLELNTANISTGDVGDSLQGYQVTLEETGNKPFQVDPTIINDLLEVAA